VKRTHRAQRVKGLFAIYRLVALVVLFYDYKLCTIGYPLAQLILVVCSAFGTVGLKHITYGYIAIRINVNGILGECRIFMAFA